MKAPKLSVRTTMCIMLLPLLGACGAYQTSEVSPVPSRLASARTTSGTIVVFDTLPVPQIVRDTVFGRRAGVPYALPVTDIAETRWQACSAELATTVAKADAERAIEIGPSDVASGSHVRITAPSLGWDAKTADVAAVHGDTLLVRRSGGLLGHILSSRPVPLSAVTQLEVSRNHGAHQGVLILAGLVGAAAGGFAGYALSEGGTPCDSGLAGFGCEWNRGFGQVAAITLGGSVGAGIGMLIAAAAVPEVWTPVGHPRPRVSVAPLPGHRLGLGAWLAF